MMIVNVNKFWSFTVRDVLKDQYGPKKVFHFLLKI